MHNWQSHVALQTRRWSGVWLRNSPMKVGNEATWHSLLQVASDFPSRLQEETTLSKQRKDWCRRRGVTSVGPSGIILAAAQAPTWWFSSTMRSGADGNQRLWTGHLLVGVRPNLKMQQCSPQRVWVRQGKVPTKQAITQCGGGRRSGPPGKQHSWQFYVWSCQKAVEEFKSARKAGGFALPTPFGYSVLDSSRICGKFWSFREGAGLAAGVAAPPPPLPPLLL